MRFHGVLMRWLVTTMVVGSLAYVTTAWSADADQVRKRQAQRVTQAQREAAAARAAARRTLHSGVKGAPSTASSLTAAPGMLAPGAVPDYFNVPNWTNSPLPMVDPLTGVITGGLRKFVDTLPGLGPTNKNNLGQYIPIANPDTLTYSGCDYYEIALVEYTERMHSDLPLTGVRLRGYVQINQGTDPVTKLNTVAPAPVHYLGPLILAKRDRAVRVKFVNQLPTGAGGELFLPVDTTVMGAGMGPLGMDAMPMNYAQNRATLHLHGGMTPWISDGTPHQWITPAGEITSYPKGVSVSNVPDMPEPGEGAQTFYYTNRQSARLMFYHDHSFGITRLNVYAGEAAGYLLTDTVEEDLITNQKVLPDLGGVYHYGIPLIIQDKTFVPDLMALAQTDPTWDTEKWGGPGNLWFPHVYMPNQNPDDSAGVNLFGRWDYGPWFWPPVTTAAGLVNGPITDPVTGLVTPGTPNVSMVMEALMDTPLVNGTAYPVMPVQRKAYRFRILNACNDRFLNLQLYYVDPAHPTEVKMVPAFANANFPAYWPMMDGRDGGVPDPTTAGPSMIQIGTEGGLLPAPVVLPNTPIGYDMDRRSITVLNVKEHTLFLGPAERADVIVDFSQVPDGAKIILYNDAPAPVPAADPRIDYFTGHPDYTSTGGAPPTLPGYGPNTRTILRFEVAGVTADPPFNLAALQAALPAAYAASQPPPIVPAAAYGSAYATTFPNTYAHIQDTSLTFTPYGSGSATTFSLAPKAIQELFELDYGRMNSTLGVELPMTNLLTQTTIPLGYADPPTEVMQSNGVQLWKITHNGVDTHAVHFHLMDVQLVNRVDWAGVIKPPDANEVGWKDTVRMNPLEDVIVAMRPAEPPTPFGIPDSIRLLNPTMPAGSKAGLTQVDPLTGYPLTVTNTLMNFEHEYVWHCHLLGHEEMDMMRPIPLRSGTVLSAAPTGLAVTRAGVLTWTDPTPASAVTTLGNPANEISFRIERAVNGGAFTLLANALANTTTYTDKTIQPSTGYTYRVYASNAAGLSPASNSAVLASVPGAPIIGTALAGNTRATVNFTPPAWNGGSAITLYTATSNPGGFLGTGTASPITVTGLTNGTAYTFTVTATNALGTGPASAPSNSVTPIALAPPAAPTGKTATVSTLSVNPPSVTLTWADNSTNETGFTIQRATNAAFTTGVASYTVGANVTTYTVANLATKTTYYFRLNAYNAAGASAWSTAVSRTTPGRLPAAPTNLTVTGSTRTTIGLSWTDNAANEQGFYVWGSASSPTGPWSRITTRPANTPTAPSTVTYTVGGVSPGRTYWFYIQAYNADGTTSSNVVAGTTRP